MIDASDEAALPTEFGQFRVKAYRDQKEREHLAVYKGDITEGSVPVRIHSECLTGDTFHSLRCDCGWQLTESLKIIEREGCGVIIYLKQEGRGIGLFNKIKAYALQENGKDTVEANNELGFPSDMREYNVAAEILDELGVKAVLLITNNNDKIDGLKKSGIHVEGRIPLASEPNKHNRKYLNTKRDKLKHML